jgi:hypothetical protein
MDILGHSLSLRFGAGSVDAGCFEMFASGKRIDCHRILLGAAANLHAAALRGNLAPFTSGGGPARRRGHMTRAA